MDFSIEQFETLYKTHLLWCASKGRMPRSRVNYMKHVKGNDFQILEAEEGFNESKEISEKALRNPDAEKNTKRIQNRLDSVFKNYQEKLEQIERDAPPKPFQAGDLLKNIETKRNYAYFRLSKVYFDPNFGGWLADANIIYSKEGINPSISFTTRFKESRANKNVSRRVEIGVPEYKWEKVPETENCKLFSRHPYTNIFF